MGLGKVGTGDVRTWSERYQREVFASEFRNGCGQGPLRIAAPSSVTDCWDDGSLNVMENGDIVQQERYVFTSTHKVAESTTVHSQLVGGFKHFFIVHNIWDNPSH